MILRDADEVQSPAGLERLIDNDLYEFVNGSAVEKPMGAKSDEIALAVGGLLRAFVLPRSLGRAYGAQTGYRCFPHDRTLVRKPDASFVPKGRLDGGQSPDGYFEVAPDLAVEVVSPNDLYAELEEKVGDYRKAGVKLIWVIDPVSRTVLIRRLDRTCAELDEAGELSGEDVVPGFACKVADLFV